MGRFLLLGTSVSWVYQSLLRRSSRMEILSPEDACAVQARCSYRCSQGARGEVLRTFGQSTLVVLAGYEWAVRQENHWTSPRVCTWPPEHQWVFFLRSVFGACHAIHGTSLAEAHRNRVALCIGFSKPHVSC
mmetsp:Transcript_55275/g.147576  ORF Transcript_55275/g.147576 Transcript_55275/m.147576 type:complete len:132 (+) Transcript_55275:1116-1511(+)